VELIEVNVIPLLVVVVMFVVDIGDVLVVVALDCCVILLPAVVAVVFVFVVLVLGVVVRGGLLLLPSFRFNLLEDLLSPIIGVLLLLGLSSSFSFDLCLRFIGETFDVCVYALYVSRLIFQRKLFQNLVLNGM
jgi:hypothetical protein